MVLMLIKRLQRHFFNVRLFHVLRQLQPGLFHLCHRALTSSRPFTVPDELRNHANLFSRSCRSSGFTKSPMTLNQCPLDNFFADCCRQLQNIASDSPFVRIAPVFVQPFSLSERKLSASENMSMPATLGDFLKLFNGPKLESHKVEYRIEILQ